jgi:hypothetical protein
VGEDGYRKVHWIAWEKLLLPKSHGGMGFRDMRHFNQALLSRQAWRLINLCARLLKAKYYPRGELVDSIFPSDASPTWKGIAHGLELVKKGIIWRVRDGRKIQILRDPWIRRPASFKVCLKKERARLWWVSQPMKPNQREWDVDVIKSCLCLVDAAEVLKLRLSDRGDEDCIAWHYERSSLFSVKSAYKLARMADQEELVQAGSSSRTDGSRGMFNEIWATPVPPKVRVFASKLSQEGLATQRNRKYCHLTKDATCRLCGRGGGKWTPCCNWMH